jgi:hypothetical protein
VRYIAPELSPGEITQLKDMEAAENNAARKQYMMSQLLQGIGDQAQTLRSQQLMAARLNEIMDMFGTEQTWLSSFSPYYATASLGGAPAWLLSAQAYAGTGGILGGGSGVTSTASGMSTLLAKEAALATDLAKANQTLTTARTRGLYEGGELIAVMPPGETTPIAPAADTGKK